MITNQYRYNNQSIGQSSVELNTQNTSAVFITLFYKLTDIQKFGKRKIFILFEQKMYTFI